MPGEPAVNPERPADVPIAQPPAPPGSNGSGPAEPSRRLSSAPVARPAPPRPRGRPGPAAPIAAEPLAEEKSEELLTPDSIQGWAWSLVLHAVLLLLLAFWYFAPPIKRIQVLDTSLAGSPLGDEMGETFEGSLGMDSPLSMPETLGPEPLQTPTFSSLAASDLTLDPSVMRPSTTPESGAANGAVNLGNVGAGAGSGDGFGVARFGSGGENINGVEVKVGDPQFTLIWDTRADIDLHVLEPGGGNQEARHIWWQQPNGIQGGELDVDDVDGFGPENVYWVQGQGPPGEYRWYVHYYGGLGGISVPTRWKVRLKHDGKVTIYQGQLRVIGERSRTYSFRLGDEK